MYLLALAEQSRDSISQEFGPKRTFAHSANRASGEGGKEFVVVGQVSAGAAGRPQCKSEPVVDVRFGSLADVQAVANYVRLAVKFGRCPSAGHKWVTLNRAIG